MSTQETLTLLRTQSLTTVVHNELEQRIIAGELEPGMPLRESTIATELGISRGPVREAFRMLEERGLVQFEKNCGVRVRLLLLENAKHIYQVRLPLEQLIAELATQALTATGRQQLKSLLAEMQHAVESEDVQGYTLLNFQFHDLLAQLSGNPPLHETYRRLVVQLKLLRSHSFRKAPSNIKSSLAEHRAIGTAILDGNAKQAGYLLSRHTQASLDRVEKALAEQ